MYGFHRGPRGIETYLGREMALLIAYVGRQVLALIEDVDTGASAGVESGVGGRFEGDSPELEADSPDELEAESPDELEADSPDALEQLVGLAGETPPQPVDPALARLFPAAYDDPEAAEEYRRYALADLHKEKVERLEALCARLEADQPEIVLSEDEARDWLAALNDVRLVLGSRVGVTEDNHRELSRLPRSDPRSGLYAVYGSLTDLQDSLVEALAGW